MTNDITAQAFREAAITSRYRGTFIDTRFEELLLAAAKQCELLERVTDVLVQDQDRVMGACDRALELLGASNRYKEND